MKPSRRLFFCFYMNDGGVKAMFLVKSGYYKKNFCWFILFHTCVFWLIETIGVVKFVFDF